MWIAAVVLAVAAAMLTSGVAHAEPAGYAGTYSGSYTKPYDIGVYDQTVVLNGDGTGTNSVDYLNESATCDIRYMIDGSDIILTMVPTNISVSGKIDGTGIWVNGHLLEKTSGGASSLGGKAVAPSTSTNGGNVTSSSIPEPNRSTSSATSSTNRTANSAKTNVTPGTTSRSMHYQTNEYGVDLPAYWNGRVTVHQSGMDGSTIEVRSKAYPDYNVCKIEVVPSRDRVTGGDIGHPTVKHTALSDGRVVCVRTTNYSWLVTSGSLSMPEDVAAELVGLTTGGKSIADCERMAAGGDNLVSANWIADNVTIAGLV